MGKVEKIVSSGEFVIKTSDGKFWQKIALVFLYFNLREPINSLTFCTVDQEITVRLTPGKDSSQTSVGKSIEVRGTADSANSVKYAFFNNYESEFD